MTANANILFEGWEAEQMKDPEFRAAAEELEPTYQAAHKEMMDDQDVTTMGMPKDPIKACPIRLCAGGFLWNEAVGDFGCQCPTCGGWGFVHDDAAEQIAAAEEFDEYEIYYRDELIAEVKDYRKGFEAAFYDLSDTTVVQKPPRKPLKIVPNKHVNNLR